MIDLDTISITTVAERLGIKKAKNSINSYHCPAHKDNTASLTISGNGMFNCFSCGTSGKTLGLIQLANNCDVSTAQDWFAREFGGKEKSEKLQVRIIKNDLDKKKRFLYIDKEKLTIRVPTELDLVNCRTEINKKFSEQGFKRAGCFIAEQPYSITFPRKDFYYNSSNTDSLLIIEGATDYLSALSNDELLLKFKIYSQLSKTKKFRLPKVKGNYYIILDPDNSAENFISRLEMKEKELREINFHFGNLLKFNIKDLSDFFASGGETSHLINYIETSFEPYDIDSYFNSNPEIQFCFWNKNGEINVYEFWRVMVQQGFFFGYMGDNDGVKELYRNQDNLIYGFDVDGLQNYVYNELLDKVPNQLNEKLTVRDIRENIMRMSGQLYDKKKYNTIPFKPLVMNKDNKDFAYYYFKNAVIKISKDSVEKVDYNELQKPIFASHVKEHNIDLVETADFDDFGFWQFLRNVCRPYKGQAVDEPRFDALRSTIGYLLHKYLSPVNQKAVIFTESNMTDAPKGRTGKGLISEAVSKLVKSCNINGKSFNSKSSFNLQNYNIGDNCVLLNDCEKSFDFESLFSLITDGFEYEKKNQSRVRIEPVDSPKFIITTNHAIRSDNSSSYKARMREMELYCYYDAEFTPADDFGEWFFHDWNKAEWDLFYCMMFSFVQFYLNNGLTKYESATVESRKLLQAGGTELIDFMPTISFDFWHEIPALYKSFIEFAGHSEREFSKKRFSSTVAMYADQNSITIDKKAIWDGEIKKKNNCIMFRKETLL